MKQEKNGNILSSLAVNSIWGIIIFIAFVVAFIISHNKTVTLESLQNAINAYFVKMGVIDSSGRKRCGDIAKCFTVERPLAYDRI